MKHRFLLDSNIIYFAVKGVDKHENPNPTCAELVRFIGLNCHTVVVDAVLLDRYQHHINELYRKPPTLVEAANFVIRILENSAKLHVERTAAPGLPVDVGIPKEDVHVVSAALISHPTLVTDDQRLLNAIKRHEKSLGLSVKTPTEALELARDS